MIFAPDIEKWLREPLLRDWKRNEVYITADAHEFACETLEQEEMELLEIGVKSITSEGYKIELIYYFAEKECVVEVFMNISLSEGGAYEIGNASIGRCTPNGKFDGIVMNGMTILEESKIDRIFTHPDIEPGWSLHG